MEISSSSYGGTPRWNIYPSFIKCPCRACFGLTSYHCSHHPRHPSPLLKFISSQPLLEPHQHHIHNTTCAFTRRPANLEISVLPSRRLPLSSTPSTCRRSPSSSPRTRGHAQQPLNGYAIIRNAFHSSNIDEIHDARLPCAHQMTDPLLRSS